MTLTTIQTPKTGPSEEEATRQWYVYLGSEASIWAHRGYTVRCGTVYCDDEDDADNVLRRALGDLDELVAVEVDGDKTYYYATQEDADADEVGSNPLAVTGPVEEG